jgi:hypothetical protein
MCFCLACPPQSVVLAGAPGRGEATARHAIRIGRWFVNRQLEALALARNGWLRRRAAQLRQRQLDFPEGRTTLGALAKSGWSNDEVRRLAGSCPDLITIERKPAGSQGGRPTEHVKAARGSQESRRSGMRRNGGATGRRLWGFREFFHRVGVRRRTAGRVPGNRRVYAPETPETPETPQTAVT